MDGRHLGRARRDENAANVLLRQAGSAHGLFFGQARGQLDGRDQRQHMVDELWKAHADEPRHRRTGRTDHRPFDAACLQNAPCGVADKLRGLCHLVHIVEAHIQKCCQHHVLLLQIVILSV